MNQITHWIGGKPWDGTAERNGPVFNPATGQQTAEVALATVAEVDAAVATAREAFETWRHSPLTRRQNIMFEYRRLVAEHRLDIARALTAEHGKNTRRCAR